jgi:hypothetical protein
LTPVVEAELLPADPEVAAELLEAPDEPPADPASGEERLVTELE